jgi:hypothetical protein
MPTLNAFSAGEYIKYSNALSIYTLYLDLSPFVWYTDTKRRNMTALLMIFSFFAGFIVCYIGMTYGVDQEGTWVSNKEFDSE